MAVRTFKYRINTVEATGINACGDWTSTLRETVGRVMSEIPVTGGKQETLMFEKSGGETEASDFSQR